MQSITIIEITPPEFSSLIKEAIREELKSLSPQDTDRWFDLPELIKYDPEHRTKHTIYSYVRNRTIPFHKRGRKLIFLKSEIDTWLKKGRIQTKDEIQSEVDNLNLIKKG